MLHFKNYIINLAIYKRLRRDLAVSSKSFSTSGICRKPRKRSQHRASCAELTVWWRLTARPVACFAGAHDFGHLGWPAPCLGVGLNFRYLLKNFWPSIKTIKNLWKPLNLNNSQWFRINFSTHFFLLFCLLERVSHLMGSFFDSKFCRTVFNHNC